MTSEQIQVRSTDRVRKMSIRALIALTLALMPPARAQVSPAGSVPPHSPRLQTIVDGAVRSALDQFAAQKLEADQVAVTLVDLRDREKTVQASVRGDAPIYPASVVKLFYLVAAHRWMEDGRLADTAELRLELL